MAAKADEAAVEGERAEDNARPSGTQTLERGLDLLDRIAERPIRMPELIAQSGLAKATVWRLVNTLINRNLVTLNDRGELQGGTKLLQLGARAQSRIDVLHVAAPVLDELAATTGISAFLGRREEMESVHLYRSASTQRVMVATPPGTRRRLSETSLGKALMLDDDASVWKRSLPKGASKEEAAALVSQMNDNRRIGAVLNKGGAPDFINAIAAPIRDAGGKIVAAMSVASPAQYLNPDQMTDLLPTITETARMISHSLGWAEPA